MASWLTYRYDTVVDASPVEVRASAPGMEAGLGYAWSGYGWSGASFSGDLSIALGARYTRLRPDVPTDGPKGTRLTLTPQWASRHDFSSHVNADVLASYSFGTRDRFVRARLGLHPIPPWRVGIEGVLSAGTDYRNVQRGGFVGAPIAPGWWVDLNAGRARSRDGKASSYIGISTSGLL